jgi:hypothetical protein
VNPKCLLEVLLGLGVGWGVMAVVISKGPMAEAWFDVQLEANCKIAM